MDFERQGVGRSGGNPRTTEGLAELAAGYGKTLPQLAIAWVLGNPAVSVALVGMRNERELEENVAAADWRLTESDRAEIGRIYEEEGVPTNIDEPQLIHTGIDEFGILQSLPQSHVDHNFLKTGHLHRIF